MEWNGLDCSHTSGLNVSETSNHLTLIGSLDTMLLMGLDKHYRTAVGYLKAAGFTFTKVIGDLVDVCVSYFCLLGCLLNLFLVLRCIDIA
jgi:hypothetical protein